MMAAETNTLQGREELAALKARVNLAEIMAESVELRKRGAYLECCCPFHEEKTPSLKVKPGESRWKCWGCDANGDVFEWLQRLNGWTLPQARAYIEARLGGAVAAMKRPIVTKPQDKAEEPVNWTAQAAAGAALVECVRAACPGAEAEAVSWLETVRFIPRAKEALETIGAWAAVLVPEDCRAVAAEAERRGVAERLRSMGMMQADALQWRGPVCLLGALAPEGAGPLYFTGRNLVKGAEPRYIYPKLPARKVLFGLPSLVRAGRTEGRLFILEGAINALSVPRLFPGWGAVAMGGRVDKPTKAELDLFHAFRLGVELRGCAEVVLVYDNDNEAEKRLDGARMAGELLSWLRREGVKARADTLPGLGLGAFKDFNAALQADEH